tara:strand:- start:1734 stop:2390 length:657 start_codon:yes stop_codon:yes gene_type:complete
MDNFELDYENDEKRIEYMTRAPLLRNKLTGKIVLTKEGYPIGDNARDPRWTGYPMSLHYNRGIMNSLPVLTGPTEFYMSDGHYAMYELKPTDYDQNIEMYVRLLRKRYKEYLDEVDKKDVISFKKVLKEVQTTKKAMEKELVREYSKLKQLEIRSGREESAKKRRVRAAARGIEVAPDDGNVKELYDSKLAEIEKIEQVLINVKTFINQLKININYKA